MGKLKLKRTPEEQAAHDLRKAQRQARKASKRRRMAVDDALDDDDRLHKKRRADDTFAEHEYVFDEDDFTPYQSHRSHKPDYDYIQAQVEEERFREKLWGAFGEDERLDTVEASMNSYAHIPRRWRGGGMDRMDDELDIDPQMMEEEDYAEWVRASMWRCIHIYHMNAVNAYMSVFYTGRSMLLSMLSRSGRRLNMLLVSSARGCSRKRQPGWRR